MSSPASTDAAGTVGSPVAGRWQEHASGWIRDVRHAFRATVRMPVVSAVIVLSFAAGIGVNATVFTWIQATVFHPLPGVPSITDVQLVEPINETGGYPGTSWAEYRDLRERLGSFQNLLASRMVAFYVGEPSNVERRYGQLVSGNFFAALGLRPALGRFFTEDEVAVPGGAPVVVVSHGFWQAHFDGAPDAVGRTLRVNDRDLAVLGVAPPEFQGTILGLGFDLWVPATLAPTVAGAARELDDRNQRGYSVMGRLRPQASAVHAQAELDGAMRDLARLYPETNAGVGGEVLSFWRAARGPQRFLVSALGFLQAVMLLLLVAVCGNTANLVLARASVRRREIGVRLALGAAPWRIVRLLLAENVVLGIAGAAGGVLVAFWGTEALRAVPFSGALPFRFQTHVDAATLAFAAILGVGSGALFGAVPAMQLAGLDAHRALRTGQGGGRRNRVQRVLMAAQVALALVVLFVAAFFFRSFRDTRDIDPGFRTEGVLLAAYDLTGRNVNDVARRAFAGRVLESLRALPSVEAAAIATSVPLDIHGLPLRRFVLEGRARTDGVPDQALSNVVTSSYFDTMGIPLLRGQDFVDLNDEAARPQVIVNEEFVRRYIGGAEPLGRRLDTAGRRFTIIGVVRNSLSESFGEPPTACMYLSYRDRPSALGQVHLRTRTGKEDGLVADVRRIVRAIDPTLPVYDVRTLAEHIDQNLVLRRIPARMFVVLGPLLLALAAIGIYAVVSYGVAQRTAEISLRLALGATGGRVIRQIVWENFRVILLGAIAGIGMALLIGASVVRNDGTDVVLFITVPTVLLSVAALACWWPARRAVRVSPSVALRQE
jgi:predicted permease